MKITLIVNGKEMAKDLESGGYAFISMAESENAGEVDVFKSVYADLADCRDMLALLAKDVANADCPVQQKKGIIN